MIPPDVVTYAARVGVDLATRTFPNSYGSPDVTLDKVAARGRVSSGHPEFVRRLFLLMVACAAVGVRCGIGGLTRYFDEQLAEFHRRHTTTYLPGRPSRTYLGVRYWLRPGFASYAPPGSSNHEEGTTPFGAIAADMVAPDGWGVVHQLAADWGLKHFANVNNEPWHMQPVELPNSRSDVDRVVAATGGHLPIWPLPPDPNPPNPPGDDDAMLAAIFAYRGDAARLLDDTGTDFTVDVGDPAANGAIVTVHVVDPPADGYVLAHHPDDPADNNAATIAYDAGRTVSNTTLVACSAGRFRVHSLRATRIVVDLVAVSRPL